MAQPGATSSSVCSPHLAVGPFQTLGGADGLPVGQGPIPLQSHASAQSVPKPLEVFSSEDADGPAVDDVTPYDWRQETPGLVPSKRGLAYAEPLAHLAEHHEALRAECFVGSADWIRVMPGPVPRQASGAVLRLHRDLLTAAACTTRRTTGRARDAFGPPGS